MAKKNAQNSPKVVALLIELANIKEVKGWTVSEIRDMLNEHLQTKIPRNRIGDAQVGRWMRPYSTGFVEPRGEVTLAIQSVVIANRTHSSESR